MATSIKLVVRYLDAEEVSEADYEFAKDHISIGRAARNDVALDDPQKRVSNRHARIDREGGSVFLIDLASTNGTWVDGLRAEAQQRIELHSGSLIEVGGFELRLELAGDEPAPDGAGNAAAAPAGSAPGGSELESPALSALRRLSQRFLGREGLGDEPSVVAFCERLERALASSFEWLSKSLMGRAEFKGRFGADVTMMFELGSNPIKDAAGAEEIARYVLDHGDGRSGEDMSASLDDAFRDLTLHQLGLLAGVQDCMKTVLNRMAPAGIEERLGSKAHGLGSGKRLWAEFVKVHKELFEDTSRLFSEVIYPSMRKGYLTSHAVLESGGGPEKPEENKGDS